MNYKVKECFEIAKVGEDFMVVPNGTEVKNNPCVLVFNETGAFLWKFLESGATEKQLCDELSRKYGISSEMVCSDVKDFLKKMEENGLLEQ